MTDTWDSLIYLTLAERIDWLTRLVERQTVAGDVEAAARTREAIERECAPLVKPQPEGVRLQGWEV